MQLFISTQNNNYMFAHLHIERDGYPRPRQKVFTFSLRDNYALYGMRRNTIHKGCIRVLLYHIISWLYNVVYAYLLAGVRTC